MKQRFADKDEARQAVWDRLQAERLFEVEPWRSARRIKVNPDAPQRPVREAALRRGITVFVPSPRLRAGFKMLDPARIPDDQIRTAASLTKGGRFAQAVPLEALPAMDAIVCGSVAVTHDGRRCGKGEGYSDLEYAILRELGHPPAPVATTVHPVQIVGGLPRAPTDLPLAVIVTPREVVRVPAPPPAPAGIDWARLSQADLDAMPVLRRLAEAVGRS
jgi:5-formyltetrahydrofolate cyclo-ligase